MEAPGVAQEYLPTVVGIRPHPALSVPSTILPRQAGGRNQPSSREGGCGKPQPSYHGGHCPARGQAVTPSSSNTWFFQQTPQLPTASLTLGEEGKRPHTMRPLTIRVCPGLRGSADTGPALKTQASPRRTRISQSRVTVVPPLKG